MSRAVLGLSGAAGLGAAYYYYFRPPSKPKNMAFVFVKPQQTTDKVKAMVRDGLVEKGLKITGEGDISSEAIDKGKLVDQHYYAIASKASILKPSELNVPNDKFQKAFGVTWNDVLSQGLAYNALDACQKLNCTPDEINKAWAAAKKNNKLVKLGGGFYCGLVELDGKPPIYVFNAFFMSMRSEYTQPGRTLHWYTVEWEEEKLSWADFRGKVLGPTDPKDAPADSLRGKAFADWRNLDLKTEPNVGDNAVHASASPFEGVCERMNWLGVRCRSDAYCNALLHKGVKESTIKAWSKDPQVKYPSGKKGSMWDFVEDMDAQDCLDKVKELQELN